MTALDWVLVVAIAVLAAFVLAGLVLGARALRQLRTDRVDAERVKTALPHGQVTVNLVRGGLDVPDEAAGDVAIIASAAVTVRLDLA